MQRVPGDTFRRPLERAVGFVISVPNPITNKARNALLTKTEINNAVPNYHYLGNAVTRGLLKSGYTSLLFYSHLLGDIGKKRGFHGRKVSI